MLEALLQEVNEDRLGAALIRPGDTVIIKIRFPFRVRRRNWVEPRYETVVPVI